MLVRACRLLLTVGRPALVLLPFHCFSCPLHICVSPESDFEATYLLKRGKRNSLRPNQSLQIRLLYSEHLGDFGCGVALHDIYLYHSRANVSTKIFSR